MDSVDAVENEDGMFVAASDQDAVYKAETAAAIFGRISSQTKLFSLSTAYTRFGVWSRRETDSAVHVWGQGNHASPFMEDPTTETDGQDSDGSEDTGSTSPGSYAYSYLSQSSYRVDARGFTYPSKRTGDLRGQTLANTGSYPAYVGDALIRVTWSPLDTNGDADTSTSVPIFSAIFERVG